MRKKEISFNPPNLDSCPVAQECKRIKEKVGREWRKDPEKFRTKTRALAKEWGMEIVNLSAPWYIVTFRKLRYRLIAKIKAKKTLLLLGLSKKVTSN